VADAECGGWQTGRLCVNTEGSFECACDAGYTDRTYSNETGATGCEDVNECLDESLHDCHVS